MSFLPDHSYRGKEWVYDSYFAFSGTYRTEGKKLYAKQFCKPEKLYTFELNTEHITLNTSASEAKFSNGSYVKIKDSAQRTLLNNAILKLKNNSTTQSLRSHPKQSGKFIFAKVAKYGVTYSTAPSDYDSNYYHQIKTYTFSPNGIVKIYLYDSVLGSASTNHNYYIEAGEYTQKKIFIGKDKHLTFNQSEKLLCIDDKEVIELQKE
jgi:hypothetical protein